MKQQIKKIIDDSLSPDETIQEGLPELLESIVARVIEVGAIKKDSQTYRISDNHQVTDEILFKRIINNLVLMTRPIKPYRVGLIDATDDTLKARQKMVSDQMNIMLGKYVDKDERQQAADDLAEVLLTSWYLISRF